MTTEAWVMLVITIGVWLAIDFAKARRQRATRPAYATPVGYHAPARLFAGWVVVLVMFNVTGFISMHAMKFIASHNWNALFVLGILILWLFFTAHVVMPAMLPADVRRRQEAGKVNLGTALMACSFAFWMIAQMASIWSWITTVS